MSISDNAKERARIARLNALKSEEQVQNFGEVEDSRVVVINYDPDKKAYLVRTLGGQIGYAMNISGTQLGVGATVQATRKGNGFIIDYFDQGSGKTTNSSDNNLSKNAFNNSNNVASGNFNTGFSPFSGLDLSNSTIGYKPDGQGGCDVKTYPLNTKLPDGVYATAKECQDSQKTGSFKCVEGQGCVEVTDGSGKYKTKAECEATLVPAGFTGGQCNNVIYSVSWTINVIAIPFPTGYTLSGSTVVTGPVERIIQDKVPNGAGFNTTWFIKGKQTASFPTGKYPFPASVAQVTSGGATITSITRVDSLPDNCGDPQKLCPS